MSIVNAQYRIKVGSGVTAVMAPKVFAYLNSGQMTGMLGGMKGAADYERLVKKPGTASKGMAAQSLVHLFIILSVIVGNIIYFMEKKKAAGARR
jgi:tetrahydromethanopterin S-methyltransferase subunit D